MYRWYTAILLLIAFAVQSFSPVLIVAEYYANTAAFAQHCENKTRPSLKCAGKCQLMKKLQEEKKSGQSSELKGGFKNEVVSSRSFFAQPLAVITQTAPLFSIHPPGICPPGKATDIFHPPLLF